MAPTLSNLQCLVTACGRLDIPFITYGEGVNLVTVSLSSGPRHFANHSTPFNSSAIVKICQDKDFSHKLLAEAVVMPKAEAFFDPTINPTYAEYSQLSLGEILIQIENNFSQPVIVKMNQGRQGRNVFLCHDKKEAQTALENIFNKNSRHYDYLALVEEYIEPVREFRAIFFNRELAFFYEKYKHQAEFVGNLSPLHHLGAKAVYLDEPALAEKIKSLISPIFSILPVEFAGFDIIEDRHGKLWLVEVNCHPGFEFFLRDNDSEPVIALYASMLQFLSH